MAQRPTRRPEPPNVPDFDDLLTISEAAALTGMAEYTVRRWARRGLITAYRVGSSSVRFSRTELRSLIAPIPADADFGGAA